MVKNLPVKQKMQETLVQSLGQEDCLEEGMVTHSSILAWRIPKYKGPGGLQSTGLQRVGHDRVTKTWTQCYQYSGMLAIQPFKLLRKSI